MRHTELESEFEIEWVKNCCNPLLVRRRWETWNWFFGRFVCRLTRCANTQRWNNKSSNIFRFFLFRRIFNQRNAFIAICKRWFISFCSFRTQTHTLEFICSSHLYRFCVVHSSNCIYFAPYNICASIKLVEIERRMQTCAKTKRNRRHWWQQPLVAAMLKGVVLCCAGDTNHIVHKRNQISPLRRFIFSNIYLFIECWCHSFWLVCALVVQSLCLAVVKRTHQIAPNDARHTMEIAIVNGRTFFMRLHSAQCVLWGTKSKWKESKSIVKCARIQDTEKW